MKVLYKKLEINYLDNDFRTECSNADIISLTRAILNSNLSDETKSTILYQFNSNLITIKSLADKLLANTDY